MFWSDCSALKDLWFNGVIYRGVNANSFFRFCWTLASNKKCQNIVQLFVHDVSPLASYWRYFELAYHSYYDVTMCRIVSCVFELMCWELKKQWLRSYQVLRLAVTAATWSSNVATGSMVPLIGSSTKMQNEKNTTFLALLRLLYALEWTK